MSDGSPEQAPPLLGLDFLYMPSDDVARDVEYFTGVLGARLEFAIEAFGTRVAMVRLTDDPPVLLFAGHLGGERPVLVYRVESLEAAMSALEARGWEPEPVLGIPHGPMCAFRTAGGHRIAIYELTRPGAAEHLAGRRDF